MGETVAQEAEEKQQDAYGDGRNQKVSDKRPPFATHGKQTVQHPCHTTEQQQGMAQIDEHARLGVSEREDVLYPGLGLENKVAYGQRGKEEVEKHRLRTRETGDNH